MVDTVSKRARMRNCCCQMQTQKIYGIRSVQVHVSLKVAHHKKTCKVATTAKQSLQSVRACV